jgi:hypothetical protein
MLAQGSDAAKRSATFRQDWLDLKADLRRWSRIERLSAGLIAIAVAILPATLALFGQG